MIAQLKFIATYFVPSLYPAMITFTGSILGGLYAAFAPPPLEPIGEGPGRIVAAFIPGTVEPWLLNLFAFIGVLTLFATFALTIKKLFGRQPSLNEVLSGLVSVKTLDGYKEEQRLRCVGLEKQISEARHSFDEVRMSDLKRNEQTFERIFQLGESRDRDMGKLRDTISRLQERTENHIRKLDQYDAKMDNLLQKVSEAAARGVRQAQQDS